MILNSLKDKAIKKYIKIVKNDEIDKRDKIFKIRPILLFLIELYVIFYLPKHIIYFTKATNVTLMYRPAKTFSPIGADLMTKLYYIATLNLYEGAYL
jgi:hypothetical protein